MMRLYVIVDSALKAGLKMAQSIHAFQSFADEYPDLHHSWFKNSNNIVVLETDELDLWAKKMEQLDLSHSTFREPDLADQLTAICVEPAGKRHLRKLSLAR